MKITHPLIKAVMVTLTTKMMKTNMIWIRLRT